MSTFNCNFKGPTNVTYRYISKPEEIIHYASVSILSCVFKCLASKISRDSSRYNNFFAFTNKLIEIHNYWKIFKIVSI
jgi:hypothetical protein